MGRNCEGEPETSIQQRWDKMRKDARSVWMQVISKGLAKWCIVYYKSGPKLLVCSVIPYNSYVLEHRRVLMVTCNHQAVTS